ncbi:hypothetical protein NDU88_005729 [Pleurodeles waltl]|uniref:Uncharacterized protein n=1 Tax=Pleurodeles waltl TaxID=8319 RepID=A0AAV7QJW0_PLEWA|nr:hypothetical protein NDU88_005729 [Pleurodeles waltl]
MELRVRTRRQVQRPRGRVVRPGGPPFSGVSSPVRTVPRSSEYLVLNPQAALEDGRLVASCVCAGPHSWLHGVRMCPFYFRSGGEKWSSGFAAGKRQVRHPRGRITGVLLHLPEYRQGGPPLRRRSGAGRSVDWSDAVVSVAPKVESRCSVAEKWQNGQKRLLRQQQGHVGRSLT